VISQFKGKYAFLSSFYQASMHVPIGLTYPGGVRVPDVEHAFQAAKAILPDDARWVLDAPTAREARQRGRHITCRADWDAIKRQVMLHMQLAKFRQHEGLLALLGDTGRELLLEGNTWGDDYWGAVWQPHEGDEHRRPAAEHLCTPGCDGYWRGHNYLGRILMAVRMVLC
jgi:ribA/ribD-fused uncharacterized protein